MELTPTSLTEMFTTRKTSLPSPSLEDSFFPLSSSSSVSLSFALPSSTSPGCSDSGGGIETDLILAAELGQALLEKNEELAASLEQSQRQVEVWKNALLAIIDVKSKITMKTSKIK